MVRFRPLSTGRKSLRIPIHPNDNRERVDSEDIELKRARASIASIKDSWKPGSNYEELIHLAHTEIPYGRIEIKKRFHVPESMMISFYYTLDDIQSPEAKELLRESSFHP